MRLLKYYFTVYFHFTDFNLSIKLKRQKATVAAPRTTTQWITLINYCYSNGTNKNCVFKSRNSPINYRLDFKQTFVWLMGKRSKDLMDRMDGTAFSVTCYPQHILPSKHENLRVVCFIEELWWQIALISFVMLHTHAHTHVYTRNYSPT